METHLRPGDGDNARELRPTRINRRTFSATATQNLSLRDRFELDRPCSSHGHNHHKVRSHVSSPPPTAPGNHTKPRMRRFNATDDDELVKHMSNLPSFLERGEKSQEKAFNVGVLDWSLLEKWQSSKQVPYRSDGSSSSNSNSSSLFSTEESLTCSQTGQSPSAAQHSQQHSVYRFHLKGFPSEAATLNGKTSCNVSTNQLQSTAESTVKEGSGSKGHCHSDLGREARRSRRSQSISLNHKFTESEDKAILVRPLDNCSVITKSKGARRKIPNEERSRTDRSTKAQLPEPSGDIPRSCPLPCDVNDQTIRLLRPYRSQETKNNGSKSEAGSQHHAARKLISPSKEVRSSKDNPDVLMTALPKVTNPPQESRKSRPLIDATKPRCTSPTGRLSFPIGTSSKKSNCTEDAEVLQGRTAQAIAKPCTKREVPPISLEKSSCNKSASTSKARSSPLKRLLEPLRKPREGTSSRSSVSLKTELNPVGGASEKLDRPSTAPAIRIGLNLNNDKSTSILNSYENRKNGKPAVIQALLQIVVQNGCPFFTFAVDNIKGILCAALSNVSMEKTYGDVYFYTFFSIHGLKNKSWMNLRGKGNQAYSPNVVAQMEVSETRISNMADHPSTSTNLLQHFVLLAVDLKSEERIESGYELAAMVVSTPLDTNGKVPTGKCNRTTTVILPSGIHTVPSKGGPSSLIQRWRTGGQCDCGGWDAGCNLQIITDSKCQSSWCGKFKLYDQGGAEGKSPVFDLAPFKDKEGVLSVSFSSSISPLQAFSISLAVLDAKKYSKPPKPAKVQEVKSLDETCQIEVHGGHISVPPHSPIGRV